MTVEDKSAVCLVVVSEAEIEPEPALVAELSATSEFDMVYSVFNVTVTEATLSLYEDGNAMLNVTFTMFESPMSLTLPCTYEIVDCAISLTVTGFGDGEGTAVYGDGGEITGINFTTFFGDEQDISFASDEYEGSLYVSRRLETPDPDCDELDAAVMKVPESDETFEGFDCTISKSTVANDEGQKNSFTR